MTGKVAVQAALVDASEPGTAPALPANTTAHSVWRVCLLIAFIALTVPVIDFVPNEGLDASWIVGLNVAHARGMVFGEDMAWTYGPLGFVLLPLNMDSNWAHAQVWRLLIHLLWISCTAAILFRLKGYVAPLLFIAMFSLNGMLSGHHNLHIRSTERTPVLLLVTIGFLLLSQRHRRHVYAVPAVLMAAFTLLAMFALGVVAAVSLAIWSVYALVRDRAWRTYAKVGALWVGYVAAVLILYRVYGGPLSALPRFLTESWALSSAHGSEMVSSLGLWLEPFWYVLMAVLAIVAAIGLCLRRPYMKVMLLVFLPLFTMYKWAIMRADHEHLYVAWFAAASFLALLLLADVGSWERVGLTLILVATVTVGGVAMLEMDPSPWFNGVRRTKEGIRFLREQATWFQGDWSTVRFRDDSGRVSPSLRADIGDASIDVYPWRLYLVAKKKLNWKPRYVYQSYMAFLPKHDRLIAESFRHSEAPKFVLYEHRGMDGTHPCMTDPQTWMAIYQWYEPAAHEGDLLLLKRRKTPRWDRIVEMGRATLVFGRQWQVPPSAKGPVILRAKFRGRPTGRLLGFLQRGCPPTIEIEYADGTTKRHRLRWRNAASGFLVSDLPRDLPEAREMFQNGRCPDVRKVTFHGNTSFFDERVDVSWARLDGFDRATRPAADHSFR